MSEKKYLDFDGLSRYDGKVKDYLTRKGIVAGLQANTTASKAYAVDDYFILNDNLYRVTTAIASGGTIVTSPTSGYNCIAVNVGDELSDVKGAISKDTISQTIFDSQQAVLADMNSAGFGSKTFNGNTANRPITSTAQYGTVYTFKANNWVYQIAIDTAERVFLRSNINNGGWSSWTAISANVKPTITFNYAVGGSVFMRVHSTQRKLIIPIPLGYTTATVTFYNNNNVIKARAMGDYSTSYDFTGTSLSTTINGPSLFLWINGTGLESYGDLIATTGDVTIELSA